MLQAVVFCSAPPGALIVHPAAPTCDFELDCSSLSGPCSSASSASPRPRAHTPSSFPHRRRTGSDSRHHRLRSCSLQRACRIRHATGRCSRHAWPRVSTAPVRLITGGRTAQAGIPTLRPGVYLVSWEVQSVDGHASAGEFAFAVGDADAAIPAVGQRAPSIALSDTAATALFLGGLVLAITNGLNAALCSHKRRSATRAWRSSSSHRCSRWGSSPRWPSSTTSTSSWIPATAWYCW